MDDHLETPKVSRANGGTIVKALPLLVLFAVALATAQQAEPAAPSPSIAGRNIASPSDDPSASAFTAPKQRPQGGASPVPAAEHKWEIEVHGGGTLANNATGGTANLPGPGASFTTVGGVSGRRVSSWCHPLACG